MNLRKQIDSIDEALEDLREVVNKNAPRTLKIPVSLVADNNPNEMEMKQGEWVTVPHWPGMRFMLTHTDEDTFSRYILCEVSRDLDMGAHKHEGFVEEIYMMEGELIDVIHGKLSAGNRIKLPAGESHWPTFLGPALFMVVFREVGSQHLFNSR